MSSTTRGLILGGGGLLGAAWMVGAMCALEEELDIDLTAVDFVAGTSAGSVVATLLAGGISPKEMAAHQRGEELSAGLLGQVAYDYGVLSARPARPALGLGSPSLLWEIVRKPRAFPLPTVLAALLPRGRGPMGSILELVDTVLPTWPERPELGLCAMDFATGDRRIFGPSDTGVSPSVAVSASCALPAWFAPVSIDGRTYVDGGSYSFTSVDVAAGRGLDEVYVLAPLAHVTRGIGRLTVSSQLLRWWRLPQTRRMYTEVEKLRDEGTSVRVVAPTAEDIAELGLNPMADTNRVAVLETAIRTYQRSEGT